MAPKQKPDAQKLRIEAAERLEKGDLAGAEVVLNDLLFLHPDDWQAATAFEWLGDICRQTGRYGEAEQHYREAIATAGSGLSGTSGMVHVSLAELLLERLPQQIAEVLPLLQQARPHLHFNAHRFRWNRAAAIAADQLGDHETRRAAAREALRLADAPPDQRRHPDVGLVHANADTLLDLRRLAE